MSKIIILSLFIGVLSCFAGEKPEEVLSKALYQYETNKAFEMKFQIQTENSMTGDKASYQGFMKTGGDGQFVLKTPSIELYSDGTTFWDYRLNSKQVIVKNYSDVQMKIGPSQILLQYLGCQAKSMIAEKMGSKVLWKLELIPSADLQQFAEIRVWLDQKTFEPVKMETLDYSENFTQYLIENFTILKDYQNVQFMWPRLDGVEVIDMR